MESQQYSLQPERNIVTNHMNFTLGKVLQLPSDILSISEILILHTSISGSLLLGPWSDFSSSLHLSSGMMR